MHTETLSCTCTSLGRASSLHHFMSFLAIGYVSSTRQLWFSSTFWCQATFKQLLIHWLHLVALTVTMWVSIVDVHVLYVLKSRLYCFHISIRLIHKHSIPPYCTCLLPHKAYSGRTYAYKMSLPVSSRTPYCWYLEATAVTTMGMGVTVQRNKCRISDHSSMNLWNETCFVLLQTLHCLVFDSNFSNVLY